ncbi:ycf20-like protein [Beta vulgaris subsp. vulgaris]|uniref:ycf20-like protein n=1 Tax=Beta vulgaris subsp. vulgaris TaxID=3555 RepID=UPI002036823C|nr:ycf20-like protein [Beta vulgaris subsp. vulgaris]XP_010692204.2 ycf20-like protein [Beta vulgaris subsp. vulgaris]
MILYFGTRLHQCPNNVMMFTPTKYLRYIVSSIQVKELSCSCKSRRRGWSIRSSADGRGFDPLSGTGDGRTRLLKAIQTLQIRLNARIRDFRKDLPRKFFFFLVGFYCATAFATVIGQTGDWDILSAAVAVAVVEGIGALMYKVSVPLLDRSRNLIAIFNYWKAGLTMGLFLDSFKY